MAYSIYRTRLSDKLDASDTMEDTPERHLKVWDAVLRENIFVLCKTQMAKSITRRTLRGFRQAKVNTRYFENLINQISNKTAKFVAQMKQGKNYWKANEDNDMKFTAIVGNPPYQEEGLNTRKAPIYHLFYDAAFKISDKVTLITPGRFLFKVGQTPKEWMDKILNDEHFKVVNYYQRSADIFPTVEIKGGVVVTYRDAKKNFGKIGIFSEYNELRTILQKVLSHSKFSKGEFSNIVSSQGVYKFTDCVFKDFPNVLEVQGKGTASKITSNCLENMSELFVEEQPNDVSIGYIKMIGRSNSQRVIRWIKDIYVQNIDSLAYYNVLITEANGTGTLGETLSSPIVVPPMVGHTDTFLSIGMFETQSNAESCLKYIKTKFARTLLGSLKATQHNPKDTWSNVPMQDFTSGSDIDWSKSVAEIDQQLYAKYGLDESEIAFIESKIKPME